MAEMELKNDSQGTNFGLNSFRETNIFRAFH